MIVGYIHKSHQQRPRSPRARRMSPLEKWGAVVTPGEHAHRGLSRALLAFRRGCRLHRHSRSKRANELVVVARARLGPCPHELNERSTKPDQTNLHDIFAM